MAHFDIHKIEDTSQLLKDVFDHLPQDEQRLYGLFGFAFVLALDDLVSSEKGIEE